MDALAMFYLQQKDKFDSVAKLSAPDGALELLLKSASDDARAAAKTGTFAYVDGRLVCLFRLEGTLWLRVDGLAFPVTDDVSAEWTLFEVPERTLRARFRVVRGGTAVIDFEYRPFGNRKIIPGDDTPFVDEEDYDYLILVSRVIQEPRRRAAYYRKTYTG